MTSPRGYHQSKRSASPGRSQLARLALRRRSDARRRWWTRFAVATGVPDVGEKAFQVGFTQSQSFETSRRHAHRLRLSRSSLATTV
jgi:hypothetical protein